MKMWYLSTDYPWISPSNEHDICHPCIELKKKHNIGMVGVTLGKNFKFISISFKKVFKNDWNILHL